MKVFLAFWGAGYGVTDSKPCLIVESTIDDFTEDQGYDEEAIKKISELEPACCAVLDDLSGTHCVVRIK